jgi:hypothetical protein
MRDGRSAGGDRIRSDHRNRRRGLNHGRMLVCHRQFDWRRVSIGLCGSCWSRSLWLNWPPSKQTRSKRDGCRGRLGAGLT